MKPHGLIGTATVLLLLGTNAPAYARQEKPKDETQPQKQEQPSSPKKSQPPAKARPARRQQPRPQAEQPLAQSQRAHQPLRQHEPAQPAQQPQARPRVQRTADRPAQHRPRVQQAEQRRVWSQYRAGSWQTEHRTWQQRGGYQGSRIADTRFRQYFGQNHGFRIYNLPLVIVGGRPRFQVGGLWFSLVDPWPEYWSNDWYESDDVYVDYTDDGYYLYNRNHPDVRLAVTVYLS